MVTLSVEVGTELDDHVEAELQFPEAIEVISMAAAVAWLFVIALLTAPSFMAATFQ
jgi:hypothetical protein